MDSKLLIGMIGERISVERKRLGLTQVEFARRAGVSPRTIGTIESGVAEELTLSVALKVLAVLGLTLRVRADDPVIEEYKPLKRISPMYSLR